MTIDFTALWRDLLAELDKRVKLIEHRLSTGGYNIPGSSIRGTPTDDMIVDDLFGLFAYPAEASGHVIEDEGVALTQRANLNFVGAGVAATDDAGNDATIITVGAGLGLGDLQHSLVLGIAGAPPAATSNDAADFQIVVPFDLTLTRLKATMKTAPSATLTVQVRRSTDSGATFSNFLGTVTVASAAVLGVADPADQDVSEGDMLNISVTVGGGTGTNLAVFIIGKRR